MLFNWLAKSICATAGMYFLLSSAAVAQMNDASIRTDTLKLDLKQAERVFLDSNLELLAQQYNIKSNKALVEQARKWDNPVLNTDQNIYTSNGFFQHNKDANGNPQGEVFVQVQQLIKTAGKRGKQTDLARTNVTIAELQFKSVMRSLRAELIKDFYTIAQLQSVGRLYQENLASLTRLLAASGQELKAGNIARKEYLRVQALLISLRQDIAGNAKDINDAESELKTLLRITGNKFILPVAPETEPAEMPAPTIMQLVDTALANNSDYQQEVYQMQFNQQNYRLQKAMAVPDLTIGTEFDQSANYAPNYFGLAISLPIPLWDRNQGNIKAARYQVAQQEAMKNQAAVKLQNDVMNAWLNLKEAVKLNTSDDSKFYQDYYELQQHVMESFGKRQISMVEFLDYFNNYQAVRTQQLTQTLNLRLAKEALNEITGTNIIK